MIVKSRSGNNLQIWRQNHLNGAASIDRNEENLANRNIADTLQLYEKNVNKAVFDRGLGNKKMPLFRGFQPYYAQRILI
jgi:hypothetical protein